MVCVSWQIYILTCPAQNGLNKEYKREDLQKLKEYGCFLVFSDDFANYDTEIFKWLKSNGFRAASVSGNFGCRS